MTEQQAIMEPRSAPLKNSPIWMYLTIGLIVLIAAGLIIGRAPLARFSNGTEYSSAIDGFSVRYPAGWDVVKREELAKFQGVFVFAAENPKIKAVFGISVQPGQTKNVKLDEVATALDKTLPENFASFNKLSQEKFTLNGYKALKYDYVFTAQDKSKVRERLVIVAAPKRVFHLAAWAPRAGFPKLSKEFDRMIGSFSAE